MIKKDGGAPFECGKPCPSILAIDKCPMILHLLETQIEICSQKQADTCISGGKGLELFCQRL